MFKSSPFGEVPGEPYSMLPLEQCGIEDMTTAQRAATRRIAHDGLHELDKRGVLQAYDIPLLAEDIFDGVQGSHFQTILPSIPGIARENTVRAWLNIVPGPNDPQVFRTDYLDGLVGVVPRSLRGAERSAALKQQHSDLELVSEIAQRVVDKVISDEFMHHDAISPRTLVNIGASILAEDGRASFARRYDTATLPYIRKYGSLERAEDGEYWLKPNLRVEQKTVASLLPPVAKAPAPIRETESDLPASKDGTMQLPKDYEQQERPVQPRNPVKPSTPSRPAYHKRGGTDASRRERRTLEATPDTPPALTQVLSTEALAKLASLRGALTNESGVTSDSSAAAEAKSSAMSSGEGAKTTARQKKLRTKSGVGKLRKLAEIADEPEASMGMPGRSIKEFKVVMDQADLRRRLTQEKIDRLEALPEPQLHAYLTARLQAYCEQRRTGTIKTVSSIFKDVVLGKNATLPADAGRDVSLLLPRSRELFDGILAQNPRLSRHNDLPFYVVAPPGDSEEQVAEAHAKIEKTIQSVDTAVTNLLEKGITSIELKELRITSERVGHAITNTMRAIFTSYVRHHPQILIRDSIIHLYANTEAKQIAIAEHPDDR